MLFPQRTPADLGSERRGGDHQSVNTATVRPVSAANPENEKRRISVSSEKPIHNRKRRLPSTKEP